jgi:hypothetical protein
MQSEKRCSVQKKKSVDRRFLVQSERNWTEENPKMKFRSKIETVQAQREQ